MRAKCDIVRPWLATALQQGKVGVCLGYSAHLGMRQIQIWISQVYQPSRLSTATRSGCGSLASCSATRAHV